MTELNPGLISVRLLAGWPRVALFVITGALLGWAFSEMTPPVFEAVAVIDGGIDYGRALPLDDRAERHAFNRVQEVILSDAVLAAALDPASFSGGPVASIPTVPELRQRLRLFRLESRWELRVSGEDPTEAAALANAWADSALESLHESVRHAWRAGELQTVLFNLGCVLQAGERDGQIAVWECSRAEDSEDPDALVAELVREAELSAGILPSMSFSLLRSASPPEIPAARGRGGILLAGTLAGLILGSASVLVVPKSRD